MKVIRGLAATVGLALSALGCATSFTGSAHVEGGRGGCETKCRGQGMQVAGMVYMGEYSSACVCQVPGTAATTGNAQLMAASAAAAGSSAGVMMQMQAQRNDQHDQ